MLATPRDSFLYYVVNTKIFDTSFSPIQNANFLVFRYRVFIKIYLSLMITSKYYKIRYDDRSAIKTYTKA